MYLGFPMLRNWLVYQQRENSTYQKFAVVDVIEKSELDDQILDHLAHDIVLAHIEPELLADAYRELAQDVSELNLDLLKEFLETKILPNKTNGIPALIGNFGEIVAASLLTEFEDFEIPIYKLRFREKQNWAARLTDLCLIKTSNLPKPTVCYGEVKTHTSACDLQLAVKGHNSLAKDNALADPEILRFLCNVLYNAQRFEQRELFLKIWLGKADYNRRHDLFLIHDADNWDEGVLHNLEALELDDRLVDFSVKVVLITKLRQVIDTAYIRTCVAAGAMV